jgi:hypothetical protein
MIKFVLQSLEKMGYQDDQVITTLEMRMKCGIGKCGRCNIGSEFICLDGRYIILPNYAICPRNGKNIYNNKAQGQAHALALSFFADGRNASPAAREKQSNENIF